MAGGFTKFHAEIDDVRLSDRHAPQTDRLGMSEDLRAGRQTQRSEVSADVQFASQLGNQGMLDAIGRSEPGRVNRTLPPAFTALQRIQANAFPIGEPVCQFGRGKDLIKEDKNKYVIKVNFAGSGYKAWPKYENLEGKDLTDWVAGGARKKRDYRKMYGDVENKKDSLVREKREGEREVTFYFPGPLGPMDLGAIDRGKYNIEANVRNALERVKSQIDKFKKENAKKKDAKKKDAKKKDAKIHIIIKGHSRGGVSAGLLYNEIRKNMGEDVFLHLVQYDPVPGPGHVDLFGKSYNSIELDQTQDPHGGKKVVVYSLKEGHGNMDHIIGGFTPQLVSNADIIIFTDDDHTSGLDQLDARRLHKRGFKRKSGAKIETLEGGVYVKNGDRFNKIKSVKKFFMMTTGKEKSSKYFQKKDYLIRGGRLDVLCQALLKMFPKDREGVEKIMTPGMRARRLGSGIMTGIEAVPPALLIDAPLRVGRAAAWTGKKAWDAAKGTGKKTWDFVKRTTGTAWGALKQAIGT